MDTITAIKTLIDLGLTGVLAYALFSGAKRIWVFGHVARDQAEQYEKRLAEKDQLIAEVRAEHTRDIEERDRREAQIRADFDRERVEWAAVRDRLYEVALRSTVAGEKAATVAEKTAKAAS